MNNINFTWKIHDKEFIEEFIPYSNEKIENGEAYNENEDIDYLLNLNSTLSLKDFHESDKEHPEELQDILKYDILMQMRIKQFKVSISEILYVGSDNKFPDVKPNLINAVKELFKLLKKKTVEENELENFEANFIKEIEGEVKEIFLESISKLRKPDKNNKREIINLMKKIPSIANENSERLYNLLSTFRKSYNAWGISTEQLIKMSISKQEFIENIGSVINKIQRKVQYLQHKIIGYYKFKELEDDAKKKLKYLEDYFKDKNNFKDKNGNLFDINRGRHYHLKEGCFAIMISQSGEYFALSGTDDYTGSRNDIPSNINSQNLANEIKNKVFNNKYEWSRLTDDVQRFVENGNYYELLPASISLGKEKDYKGTSYSCCERKMQADHNNYKDNKIFYSRWAPCGKCVPSILKETGNVKIYAFAKNFKEWDEKISQLKEYKIVNTNICVPK